MRLTLLNLSGYYYTNLFSLVVSRLNCVVLIFGAVTYSSQQSSLSYYL